MCVCVCVSRRELECEHYSTVVQLDCRVLMYFYGAQSCVEVVVFFLFLGGGGIFVQIWTDNPVGVKLDAGIWIWPRALAVTPGSLGGHGAQSRAVTLHRSSMRATERTPLWGLACSLFPMSTRGLCLPRKLDRSAGQTRCVCVCVCVEMETIIDFCLYFCVFAVWLSLTEGHSLAWFLFTAARLGMRLFVLVRFGKI